MDIISSASFVIPNNLFIELRGNRLRDPPIFDNLPINEGGGVPKWIVNPFYRLFPGKRFVASPFFTSIFWVFLNDPVKIFF